MVGGRNIAESTPAKSNWRGKTKSGKVARHRWQQAESKGNGTRSSRLRYGLKSIIWLVALLSLAFAFISLMQFRPRQTPVVAVVATQYDQPFLPNSWAFEDLEAIRELDGDTILLFDADDTQTGREALLADFDRLINEATAALKTNEPLVVYFSMHADVNDNSEPCFIPSGASAFNANSWIPVSELLKSADEARDVSTRPLLFVVDCHRHPPNWHRGETRNQFVSVLEERVAASDIPNLTVMTSCSTDQQSHVNQSKAQSSFGYYFAKGLAGEADTAPTGNTDNYVSLTELQQYVLIHVDNFARTAFGVSQQIRILTPLRDDPAPDFVVCWVATSSPSKSPPTVTPTTALDLVELWTRYESVRGGSPFFREPIAWGQIESQLVRTELLLAGGNAYRVPATIASSQTRQQLQQLETQKAVNVSSPAETTLMQSLDALQNFREESRFTAALNAIPMTPLSKRNVVFQLASLIAAQPGSSLWNRPEQVTEALQTRTLAEKTTQGLSSEVTLWTEPFLNAADQARLKAEDAMFSGQSATPLFQKARLEYQNAMSRGQQTQQAIDTFNRASAEVFWYSRWASENAADAESAETLIQKTRQLGLALHNSTQKSRQGATLPFISVADEVAKVLDELHEQLSDEYAELLSDIQATPEDIHRAQSLLNIALLPASSADGETGAKQRERLSRELLEQVTRREKNERERREKNAGIVQASRRQTTEFVRPQPDVELLPLLFTPAKQSSDDLVGKERHQEMMVGFRSSLESLRLESELAVNSTNGNVDEYRNALLNATGQLRIAAAMAIPAGAGRAVAARQQLDERLQQLDRCERAIDDFYGSANHNPEPYFSMSADEYLLKFRASLAESVAIQNRLLEVNNRLNARITASTDGLSVSAQDILLLDGVQLESVDVSITKSQTLPNDAFPTASGSLYFATSSGAALSDSLSVSLESMPDPALGGTESELDKRQLSLRSSVTASIPGQIFAVMNVRGNLFRQPVLVSSARGEQTRQIIESSRDVTINVDGTTAAASSVIVVFDCSQSMADLIPVEGPENTQTRFDAARNALFTLLQKLAEQRNTRVGLTFFGHRVGWNPNQPRQLLIQDEFLQGISTDLKPYNDVETLLPIGRFDLGVLQSVAPIINSTKPWGETPLYLSITEAISELQKEDQLRSRRIIVMTDGANHQVNPSAAERRSVNDVLSALPEGIRVDIVGFGVSDDDSQQARTEFEAITSQSQGQFIPVDDVTELVQSLSGLIESEDFEVVLPSGVVTLSQPGQRINLTLDDASQSVTVAMGEARETIHVSGGEAIQLILSDDKRGFFVPKWLQGNPEFVSLGRGQPFVRSAIECGIQTIQMTDATTSFEFSLQHTARQFLAKPTSVQIVVFPTDQNGNRVGVEYLADVETFRADTPVPAFGFQAMGWPPQATHAEISVSVGERQTKPIDAIPLNELDATDHVRSTHRSISGLNGVHVYVVADPRARNTVTVVEKHEDESPGLDSVVVRLNGKQTPLRKIRRVDTKNRVVATIFEFSSSTSIDLVQNSIEFILATQMQRDSLRLAKPVVLPVSTNSGLLIPTIR